MPGGYTHKNVMGTTPRFAWLLFEVERILRVNGLSSVTPAVVDAAREGLVIRVGSFAPRHAPRHLILKIPRQVILKMTELRCPFENYSTMILRSRGGECESRLLTISGLAPI
jgi:hypothetical protein